MTVKQLIEILSQIEDQETRVMVKGYEGGVDDISTNTPAIINVALDVRSEWYYGAHVVVSECHRYTDKEIVKAIVIR